MAKSRHKLARKILITLGIIFGILGLIILFLSPIVKYLVEKYDHKYTGRQITMDWAYVNPITGYVHFDDLKFFEQSGDSVFFSSSGISATFDVVKMFRGEYLIKSLTLDKPYGIVVQYSKEKFNFTDLIETFNKPKKEEDKKDTTKTKFSLQNITIFNGTFYMKETMTPVNYFIKNVNIESTGLRWDADTINTRFSFASGLGSGTVEGIFKMNLRTSVYNTHTIIRRLDLKIIEQYLKVLSNYGTMKAMINADITAKGNFKDARNVDAVGGIGIYDLHFGKSPKEDFLSFKKFVLKINKLNPKKKLYLIDSISLVEPYFKYEKYDKLDNIQYMFGKKGSKVKEAAGSEKFNLVIELANYVKLLAKNFFQSDYKVNRLGIYRGNLRYIDYSLNERFAVGLNPFTVVADSLNSNKDRVKFRLNTGIKPYGEFGVVISINPKDSSDFEMNYHLQKVNAALLNPFLVSFTSFPLDRGSIELKGNWIVKNGNIRSQNNLLIIDPRVNERYRANNNRWLPLKLFMFLVRERGNAIDYEIPITGNLKDPKFHLKDVIWDVVSNVFIKPATTPYRFQVREVENTIEKQIAFNWHFGTAEIDRQQERFIENISDFLSKNEHASLAVYPVHYTEKEKEYLTLFEAKKKYFLNQNKKEAGQFTADDSVTVARMSVKDSLFNQYLRDHVKNNLLYSTVQLSEVYVGKDKINARFEDLKNRRKDAFLNFFKEKGVAERIHMKADEDRVPFNGFSFYQLSYNGDIPDEMKEAYEELRNFDNASPRKKIKEERSKTRRFFNFKRKSE